LQFYTSILISVGAIIDTAILLILLHPVFATNPTYAPLKFPGTLQWTNFNGAYVGLVANTGCNKISKIAVSIIAPTEIKIEV
jgi:hypothetical protein